MKLRELQRRFGAAMMDGEDAPDLVRADRLDVYRNAYVVRLAEVLRDVYPRTAARLEDWSEIAARYVRLHPSRAPSLRAFGRELPSLLDPHSAALATLEWVRYDLFDAVDEPLLAREHLAADITTPLRRIVASALLELPHDADALWRGEPSAGPVTLLVWRDGTTLYHRVVDADEQRWLSAPTTVAGLAEELGDAQRTFELVGRWIADGLMRSKGDLPVPPRRAEPDEPPPTARSSRE